MEHQNWDYTVYSKGPKGGEKGDKAVNKAIREGKDVETIKKAQATNKKGAPTGSAIHKAMETEEFKTEHVSLDFRLELQKARMAKKLTQEQLAKLVNEKQSVIQDYESGRAIPNNAIIAKFEKALAARLPRQKKKKEKKEEETD